MRLTAQHCYDSADSAAAHGRDWLARQLRRLGDAILTGEPVRW